MQETPPKLEFFFNSVFDYFASSIEFRIKEVEIDVYVYIINYKCVKQEKSIKGKITLLR
jgi:hypothetical protein